MTNIDNPHLLMQDCDRKLFDWFANKPNAKQEVRLTVVKAPVVHFVSEWHKTIEECRFPIDMPTDFRIKVISMRRQIMTYAFLMYGMDQSDIIGYNLWSRLCTNLEHLQSAWGWNFGFYDFQFKDWREEKDDTLLTNRGVDGGLVNHAMTLLNAKKRHARQAAENT